MAPPTTASFFGDASRFLPSNLLNGTLIYKIPLIAGVLLVLHIVVSEINVYLSRIPHLPGPRGYPIVGSLPSLWGKVHAEQFRLWSKKYGDVFQVRLGERTAVVVNSASSARSLFLGQREAMNSRPLFYVLHGKVQQNSSVTSIGTSPWNESCKRRRKIGATAMNKVAVASYQPVSLSELVGHALVEILTDTSPIKIIDSESRGLLLDFLNASMRSPNNTVDFRDPIRKYAMNLVLTLNYGTR
jgi:3-hydroxyphenylacetate 6-hydroxylase